MLSELREELMHVQEAIITLERLAQGSGKRRGRPPAWLSSMGTAQSEPSAPAPVKRRGRPRKVQPE